MNGWGTGGGGAERKDCETEQIKWPDVHYVPELHRKGFSIFEVALAVPKT